MARSFKEKFKYFWGFESEDDELLDEEYQSEVGGYQATRTVTQPEKTKIFPTTTKNRVVNIHNNVGLKIDIFKPHSFEDAVEVVECLRNKRPVVLNLETIDAELARKIFDFLSGALCAIDGRAEKVSKGIFIMAPNSVQINYVAEHASTATKTADAPLFSLSE